MKTTSISDIAKKVIPLIRFARRSEVNKYLKLYDIDLKNENYTCAICGKRIIREDEIEMIINKNGRIILICNKPSCVSKANLVRIYEYL